MMVLGLAISHLKFGKKIYAVAWRKDKLSRIVFSELTAPSWFPDIATNTSHPLRSLPFHSPIPIRFDAVLVWFGVVISFHFSAHRQLGQRTRSVLSLQPGELPERVFPPAALQPHLLKRNIGCGPLSRYHYEQHPDNCLQEQWVSFLSLWILNLSLTPVGGTIY